MPVLRSNSFSLGAVSPGVVVELAIVLLRLAKGLDSIETYKGRCHFHRALLQLLQEVIIFHLGKGLDSTGSRMRVLSR